MDFSRGCGEEMVEMEMGIGGRLGVGRWSRRGRDQRIRVGATGAAGEF